jgi:hypothetical protein
VCVYNGTQQFRNPIVWTRAFQNAQKKRWREALLPGSDGRRGIGPGVGVDPATMLDITTEIAIAGRTLSATEGVYLRREVVIRWERRPNAVRREPLSRRPRSLELKLRRVDASAAVGSFCRRRLARVAIHEVSIDHPCLRQFVM